MEKRAETTKWLKNKKVRKLNYQKPNPEEWEEIDRKGVRQQEIELDQIFKQLSCAQEMMSCVNDMDVK